MAILNFIKSSSGKNKVAVISSSDASAHHSPKVATSKNHTKKDTTNAKALPEFKVSAMAYAFSRPQTLKLFAFTMAILNFIKSSSSKNKVAIISTSSEPGSQSLKTATFKNHTKKDAPKTKTISEFKVSAMAYAISRA
ncbi:hypothetical protein BGZ70_009128 [Mortierella alpina]|uniref:Uncharacterized protein n=1 Tax=Mortierella alpina TaxID=64518 RepID=A0A9P6M124_MORAP|nr:hypothetical protein BGZ70_009128 [Mortierella alpina]